MPNFKEIRPHFKKVTAFFCKCAKRIIQAPNPLKKKNTQKFDHPYLINDYYKLTKIHCVASPRWRAATMQKSRAFLEGSWSYACMKIAF